MAVALAWYVDHRQASQRLRQAELQIAIYERQFADLQRRLAERGGAGAQTLHYWNDADEFIEALTAADDEEQFLDFAPSLAKSDAPVLDQAIEQLVGLFEDANEQTRRRAVIAVRFLQQLDPTRMQPHADAVVMGLIPLLNDPSSGVAGETLFALETFGPSAEPARDALERHMADDRQWWAPQAALTLAAVDPSVDVGPRLIELVERKHPNWYRAAFALPKHVDPKRARSVLTELYDNVDTEGDRSAIVQALNQIQPE